MELVAKEMSRFNGAALFQVRKDQYKQRYYKIIQRFNGAALFQVRKVLLSTRL